MNVFKLMFKACYDFDNYAFFIKEKISKIIIYILLLSFFVLLIQFAPVALKYYYSGGITGLMDKYIPEFKIENGVIYSEEKIDGLLPDGSRYIVNTDENFDENLLKDGNTYVVVDKEKVFIGNMLYSNIQYAKDLKNMSKAELFEFIPLIKLSIIAGFVFMFVLYVLSEFFAICFFASAAVLVGAFMKFKAGWSVFFRLACFARTMPIILRAVLGLFNLYMPIYIYFVVVLLYLYFAMKSLMSQDGEILAVL